MEDRFATAFKSIREHFGLTQKEMAQEVCCQTMISRIESGETIPSSLLVYEFSQRLGLDISFFYDFPLSEEMSYIREVQIQIKDCIEKGKYWEAYQLVKTEKNSPLKLNQKSHLQFLLWTEGICCFYIDKNHDDAIKILNQALAIYPYHDRIHMGQHITITTSIASILMEIHKFEEALDVLTKIKNDIQHPFLVEEQVRINSLFVYSTLLAHLNEIEESFENCDLAIKLCLEHKTFLWLGELYHLKGELLLTKNFKTEGLYWLEKSSLIFEINGWK